jgi:diguanylate cyclase
MTNDSIRHKQVYFNQFILIGLLLLCILISADIIQNNNGLTLKLIWKNLIVVILIEMILYIIVLRDLKKKNTKVPVQNIEEKQLEEKLAEIKEKYQAIFDNNMDSAFLLDTDGRFIEINKMGSVITGYKNEELINEKFMPFLPPEELPYVLTIFEKVLFGEPVRLETKWIHKQGHVIDVDVTALPIFQNKQNISVFCFTRDITEQKRYQQEMKDLAYKDSLTQLPNRRYFIDYLEEKLQEAKEQSEIVAVLYIDLDSLKMINDHLGHEAGDILLMQVGSKLLYCLNKEGIVARIGGDEFGIILSKVIEKNKVPLLAEKILSSFEEGFSIEGHLVQCGASIGIVFYPGQGEDAKALIKNADTAMYSVKQSGKNNYQIYDSKMDTGSKEGFQLQQDLTRALIDEQFYLEYQTRIDALSKKVVAVEALLRWKHPVKGIISPQIFIPLAEETGFIIRLGEWVLQRTCRQLKDWIENGVPKIRMAVNVSAKQFERGNMDIIVDKILNQWDLEPDCLEIEITESTLMNESELILASIHALHCKGVHFSIDDFGKGYSSLSFLKNYKINMLKIDKSFIRNVHENQENGSITQAIISLAHSMNIRVVAEGVEKIEEMEYLIDNMVDEIQGFYISHPISPEAVFKLLS